MWRTLALLLLLSPVAHAGTHCQHANPESFAQFLNTFAKDRDFASQRILYPLTQIVWEYGIDAKGRNVSAPTQTIVLKAAAKPNQSLTELGLQPEILRQSTYRTTVRFFKANTDWDMNYHFQRFGTCWWLVKTENFSL